MAENTDALGFIPSTTVQNYYVGLDRYILQCDDKGRPVGYILYGVLRYARPVTIAQHCIQYDKRLRGHGAAAFSELLRRAQQVGASSIKLRCAENLEAVKFWQSQGFNVVNVSPGGARRGRLILSMSHPLSLPLFEGLTK